ncbi:hypothetical protein BKA64DRAFT_701417 [Cadophora sp. MPI-SDFR-AT-0126]|nr:hypothetical protein BKA64DRAFT_701417 [Leotiomycetes sp. MPI-SDFR-AT-0126]
MDPDHLLWLFRSLWSDHQLLLLSLPSLMDEIEHVLQSDPKEKARLPTWVARVYSDLGVIARLRHELDILKHISPGGFALFADERNPKAACRMSLFAKLATPTCDRFNYPSNKRRTKENTEIMRRSEQNLDLFWELDKSYRKVTKKSLNQGCPTPSRKTRELERTGQWIEPTKVPKVVPQVKF